MFRNFFFRTNIFLLIAILSGFAYLFFFGNNSLLYHFFLHRRIMAVEKEISKLEEENVNLLTEIERMKTDPLYLEFILRKNGYIKPTEKLFKIEQEKKVSSTEKKHLSKINLLFIQILFFIPVLVILLAILIILKSRTKANIRKAGGF